MERMDAQPLAGLIHAYDIFLAGIHDGCQRQR